MPDPIFPDRLGAALRRIAAFNLQAEVTARTAPAMLKALRAAELSGQPLAVGLADALEELVDRECCEDYETDHLISCNRIEAIIEQLRALPLPSGEVEDD